MNLDGVLRVGHAPWLPSPSATDLDAWHVYDIPLIGTFRHEGQVVLFTAMDDADADVSVWTYCALTPEQAQAAEDVTYEDTAGMLAAVEEICDGKEVAVALAVDLEVKLWGRLRVESGLLAATRRFLEDIRANLASELSATVLRAEIQAGVRELEDVPISGSLSAITTTT